MKFRFTPEARAQLRAIDRASALRILEGISRLGLPGAGNVAPLHGDDWPGCFRLRIGDYRVVFRNAVDVVEILTVGHRSDVYR